MPRDQAVSSPEAADRHGRILAAAMLLMSAMYAIGAASHLIGDFGGYLEYLIDGLGISLGGIVLFSLWRFRNLPARERTPYFGASGFVADVMKQARITSWTSTFIVLVVLEIASDDLPALPSEFFLQVALSVMLGVFALSFFHLNRAADEDDDSVPDA